MPFLSIVLRKRTLLVTGRVGRKQTPPPPLDFLRLWSRLQTQRLFDRDLPKRLMWTFKWGTIFKFEKEILIPCRINHQNLSAPVTGCPRWYPKWTKVLKNSCSGNKSQKSWSEAWKSWSGFDVTFKRLLIAISHHFLDHFNSQQAATKVTLPLISFKTS